MKGGISPACLSPAKLFPLFPLSHPFTHRAALFVSVWHGVGQAACPEGQPCCAQTHFQPAHAPIPVTAILTTTGKAFAKPDRFPGLGWARRVGNDVFKL